MTSIIKVDQIQNTSGTAGMTIDSSGDVTFSGPNTVTPVDSGWITPTLNSGFTSLDTTQYGPIQYRKIGNLVNIQGLTGQSSVAVVFTLPEGFRPPVDVLFAPPTNGNGAGRLDIRQNGDVHIIYTPTTGWFSLACTFFTA
jgi:hypothetical protein